MKTTELMVFAGAAVIAVAFARADEPLSDDAMKERIVQFVTLPSRMCGHALVDFREEFRNRKLTNRSWFDGDTNRLARLIAELAQTNDVEISSQMIESLGEYGTPAQLPFLYSCATNATYGAYALKSIFAIEGVTSNSVAVMQGYLSLTNALTNGQSHDRSMLCKDLLNKIFSSDELEQFRPSCLSMMIDFAQYRNSGHVSLDGSIQAVDPSYHASKRRLAVLRAAQFRCGNSFQLDYVTNAINELVAYPEANLPD